MKFGHRYKDGRLHGQIRITFEPDATHVVGSIAGMLGAELMNLLSFGHEFAGAVEQMELHGRYLTVKDVDARIRHNFSLYGWGDNDGEWVRRWCGKDPREVRALWHSTRRVIERLYPELLDDADAHGDLYVPECSDDSCGRRGINCQHE